MQIQQSKEYYRVSCAISYNEDTLFNPLVSQITLEAYDTADLFRILRAFKLLLTSNIKFEIKKISKVLQEEVVEELELSVDDKFLN